MNVGIIHKFCALSIAFAMNANDPSSIKIQVLEKSDIPQHEGGISFYRGPDDKASFVFQIILEESGKEFGLVKLNGRVFRMHKLAMARQPKDERRMLSGWKNGDTVVEVDCLRCGQHEAGYQFEGVIRIRKGEVRKTLKIRATSYL